MAGSSSSSNHASNFIDEKLVSFNSSDDGPAEVLRIGVPLRTTKAETSSLMGQVNIITYKRKRKGAEAPSNFVDEELVSFNSSDDGPIEVLRIGVPLGTTKAETSSLMGQVNITTYKRKRNGAEAPSNFIDEKLVSFNSSDDGPAEVLRIGVPLTTRKAESSSLTGQVSITYKRKRKGAEAASMECGCCYWPYRFDKMLQCRSGHWFCFKCIRKQVDQIIYGGVKAHDYLSCMAIGDCKESIPLSEIIKTLPNDVIERYEYRLAEQAVVEAKIEGLVYCPFCNIPYEIDNCLQVFDCPNPKCLIASCIQCKKLSHSPLRCEDVDKNSETALRREVEEIMTKAVIRECNVCHTEIIKTTGCNKVRCKCGNIMCYMCRQTLSYSDRLPHFCACARYTGPPWKPCQVCNRCSYIEIDMEDDEALAAREEALKELVDSKTELLDVEIGPPLKRLRQHPAEQERQHMQF